MPKIGRLFSQNTTCGEFIDTTKPDFGVIYNEGSGITKSGEKIFKEFAEILKKAGW